MVEIHLCSKEMIWRTSDLLWNRFDCWPRRGCIRESCKTAVPTSGSSRKPHPDCKAGMGCDSQLAHTRRPSIFHPMTLQTYLKIRLAKASYIDLQYNLFHLLTCPAKAASPCMRMDMTFAPSMSPRKNCSARVFPWTTGSTASRWDGFATIEILKWSRQNIPF